MIFQRQFEKILGREMLRLMILGRLPSVDEISKRISDAIGEGRITYKYLPQPPRSAFLHEAYNESLRRIHFDIETLHEEMIEQFGEVIKRFNFADLFHKVHSHELDKLQQQLDLLLFTIENADFYFVGAFDNFTDTSKLDFKASTPGVIHLPEQVLALPYGGRSNQRIPADHLFDATDWEVNLVEPRPAKVLSTSHRSPFGNMFSDLLSPWIYEVRTNEQVPVEIVLRFPLAGPARDEIEVLVSRFEMIPHAVTSQRVTLSVSTDDVNYKHLLGYEEGILISDQRKTYAMDFETNLVQFVEMRIRKETPDQELGQEGEQKTYQYLFGLKSLSAMTTGRVETARYQSLPFDFSEDGQSISRVALRSEVQTPAGTQVDFSIALAGDEGEPISSFLPVRSGEILQFGNLRQNDLRFREEQARQYGPEFKGKKLYQIGPAVDPDPIFGTASLLRGFKVWYRDSSRAFEIVQVQDNYITFARSDLENLYAVISEVPEILTGPSVGDRAAKLVVSNDILYNRDRGHLLIPNPEEQRSGVDLTPNYAIYRVLQIGPKERNTVQFQLNSRTIDLPVSNFLLDSPVQERLPVLYAGPVGAQTIYVRGRDYEFETESIGGVNKPTGRMLIPAGSQLLDNQGNIRVLGLQLFLDYTADPDVTHKVATLEGNSITLRNTVVGGSDTFEVRYRFVPVAPNEIIRASIIVKERASSSSRRSRFIEGEDYVVDPRTGSIQRMPNGRIPDDGAVFVDFKYRNAEEGIETFTTWAFVRESTQIRFDVDTESKKNKLVADQELGEKFFLNSSQGLVDLTVATATPVINSGWVQFIVRSKNPNANQTFRTNLVDQVIQLRDINKKKIFKENGSYFTEILAFREPMRQISLNHLKVNTLPKDRTVFAIDDITDPFQNILVVSYPPNHTEDLYLRVPTEDTAEDDAPEAYYEVYRLRWSSVLESENTSSKLIVRADLSRDPRGVDGSVTPKVFSYSLRASF